MKLSLLLTALLLLIVVLLAVNTVQIRKNICQQDNINEAVSQAMENYLELNGYVTE